MRTSAVRSVALAILVALIILPGIPAPAAAQSAPCEPSAKVREAFSGLPLSTGNAAAARIAYLEALRALRTRFPDDVFVHQRYQDTARYPTDTERDAVIAEYRTLRERHPTQPLYAYLAARAQIGVRTKEVLPDLEKLAGGLPSARLALASVYQSPNFRDEAKVLSHLEAYSRSCPESPELLTALSSMEPSEFLTRSTARMRTVLDRRGDPAALVRFTTLWKLEFQVTPVAQHDSLRARVSNDLKRLRGIDPGKTQSYYLMLQEGYKHVNDTAGARWAVEQMRKRFPGGSFSVVQQEWHAANPPPKTGEPPEKRKAYDAALAKATADWAREWPDQVYPQYQRVESLRTTESALPSEVEAAGESLLRANANNPDQLRVFSPVGGSSFALRVADLYARKGVRPDRLPALVAQGLTELEPRRTSWESDLYPRSSGEDSNRGYSQWYGWLTIADIWINAKDKARAREALDHLRDLADRSKPAADSKESAKTTGQRTYLSRQVEYWTRMGDFAKLDGRQLDAVTSYQTAMLSRVRPPSSAQKDELGEKTRALWKELGGGDEGWLTWTGRRDLLGMAASLPDLAGPSWTGIEKVLPEFELPDLAGATWKLANLKGKSTLLNVWAMT